jgi:hypothetical protein
VRRRLATCAALLLLVPLLFASAAQGAESPSHPFIAELSGNEGSGRTPNGAFEDACAVAVDSNNDTYVSDYYHDAVDVFDPSGAYLTQIAGQSLGNGPCALALDAAGRIYVNDWRQNVVRYTPSSYPPNAVTTYGPPTVIDASGTATGVAIDPASGILYVDDGTYIAAYEPSGLPVQVSGQPLHIGTLAQGYGLAVSAFAATKGFLYVSEAATGVVRVYDPAAPDPANPVDVIDGQGTPQGGFDYLVDSASMSSTPPVPTAVRSPTGSPIPPANRG